MRIVIRRVHTLRLDIMLLSERTPKSNGSDPSHITRCCSNVDVLFSHSATATISPNGAVRPRVGVSKMAGRPGSSGMKSPLDRPWRLSYAWPRRMCRSRAIAVSCGFALAAVIFAPTTEWIEIGVHMLRFESVSAAS
jgi:hypothetical protein